MRLNIISIMKLSKSRIYKDRIGSLFIKCIPPSAIHIDIILEQYLYHFYNTGYGINQQYIIAAYQKNYMNKTKYHHIIDSNHELCKIFKRIGL